MRYHLLDALRGLALIGMIIYHFCYDLTEIFQVSLAWFQGTGIHYWQQLNCAVFILISGICVHFSRHLLRRGILISLWGGVISVFTAVFIPEEQIILGILSFLGIMMIFCAFLKPLLNHTKKEPRFFLAVALLGFYIFYSLPQDYLNFFFWQISIPESWHNLGAVSNLLGFKTEQFSSADYFPLLPWSFLFLSGYFIWAIIAKCPPQFLKCRIVFLSFFGRHSLLVYLLHQPVIYALLSAYFAL